MSSKGMAALAQGACSTSLCWLDMEQTNIDDVGASHIAQMRGLTCLNLSHTYLTSAGVQALGQGSCTGLRHLSLCRLKGLDDSGVSALTTLTRLRALRLKHCRNVSDKAVHALHDALAPHRLQHMELEGCWAVPLSTISALWGVSVLPEAPAPIPASLVYGGPGCFWGEDDEPQEITEGFGAVMHA